MQTIWGYIWSTASYLCSLLLFCSKLCHASFPYQARGDRLENLWGIISLLQEHDPLAQHTPEF